LEADGWRYEVIDMDGRRVDKVLVTTLPQPDPPNSAKSNMQEPS
jgi:CBS domain containing-hemolysin-like protein